MPIFYTDSGSFRDLQVSGSAIISGSLIVTGSITGSLTGSVTGSLTGTASWANNVVTASYITSSFFSGSNAALSSSFASTASFASNIINSSLPSQINVTGVTASFTGSLVGALTGTSSWASSASFISGALPSGDLPVLQAYRTTVLNTGSLNTWLTCSFDVNAVANNLSIISHSIVDPNSEKFFIKDPGLYEVNYTIAGRGGSNWYWEAGVFLNGSSTPIEQSKVIGASSSGGDTTPGSITFKVSLVPNDYLILQVRSTKDSDVSPSVIPSYRSASFGVTRLAVGPIIVSGTIQNASTASYAWYVTGSTFNSTNPAQSASYAVTASYITSSFFSGSNAALSASFSATASYINPLNQNVLITGSLNISGSITGSLTGSHVGSLTGTASWANSASNAFTSSYITSSFFSGSNAALSSSYAVTASYISGSIYTSTNPALSASYATTSSYALNTTPFPYTGNAIITGSLHISGSIGSPLRILDDIYIGKGATKDRSNIIIGSSGNNHSTVSTTVIIGYNAGASVSTSDNNVFIGSFAGSGSIQGGSNTYIGADVAVSSSSGISNTILGAGSYYYDVYSTFNTAVGAYSLKYLGSGSAINTLYNYNTALGFNAGTVRNNGVASITGSSYSTYLGAYASGLTIGSTNEIAIGYSASGQGDNSVVIGNNTITKTFLKGNVAIGYKPYLTSLTPNATLDVSGSVVITGSLNISGSTVITGSLNISGSITGSLTGSHIGSLTGTASWANNVATASYITSSFFSGSNAALSSSYAVTASYLFGSISNAVNADTASYITSSFFSGSNAALSASYASTASYALNAIPFPYTGSATISGSLNISGSNYAPLRIFDVIYVGLSANKNTSNIFIGPQGTTATSLTATNNTILGYGAGNSIFSGSANTFIGNSAGNANTNGSSNTAVGVNSLTLNSTGQGNTAIGVGALSAANNINASQNTALGAGAGALNVNLANITFPVNSVYIGNNSYGLNTTSTNEIVVGYSASGQGNNTVVLGNNDITKTFLKGNVAIGYKPSTTSLTPNATLDVSGSVVITGSLNVTQGITGSLTGSVIGALTGTASWATTASYALASAGGGGGGGSSIAFQLLNPNVKLAKSSSTQPLPVYSCSISQIGASTTNVAITLTVQADPGGLAERAYILKLSSSAGITHQLIHSASITATKTLSTNQMINIFFTGSMNSNGFFIVSQSGGTGTNAASTLASSFIRQIYVLKST